MHVSIRDLLLRAPHCDASAPESGAERRLVRRSSRIHRNRRSDRFVCQSVRHAWVLVRFKIIRTLDKLEVCRSLPTTICLEQSLNYGIVNIGCEQAKGKGQRAKGKEQSAKSRPEYTEAVATGSLMHDLRHEPARYRSVTDARCSCPLRFALCSSLRVLSFPAAWKGN